MSVPEIGGAWGSVTATRAFAAGAADALAEDVFAEEMFAAEDAFAEATFAVEDAFALKVEPVAAESAAEAGVDAGAGRARRSAAKADGDNNANSMAATATLTRLPLNARVHRAIDIRAIAH
jgi:hypothetical protein